MSLTHRFRDTNELQGHAQAITRNISRNRQADKDAGYPLLTPRSCTSYAPMSFVVHMTAKAPLGPTCRPPGVFSICSIHRHWKPHNTTRSQYTTLVSTPQERTELATQTHTRTRTPRKDRVGHTHTVYYSQDC